MGSENRVAQGRESHHRLICTRRRKAPQPSRVTTLLKPCDAPVGIFDSGLGGLSVLRHIKAQLPHEHLLYFADSGFAPYGDKPHAVVVERVLTVASLLRARGAKALVIACNTATVAAIGVLREHMPELPIVGVEPGLKPAALQTRNGKVGVLATHRTLAGAKFQLLRETIEAQTGTTFLQQACVGLADLIETGELDSSELDAMLERFITPLLAEGIDTLVLGCTHYPLVRRAIETVLARHGCAHVTLVDTGDAVARQLGRRLLETGLLREEGTVHAHVTGLTTGESAVLEHAFAALCAQRYPVEEIRLLAPRI